MKALRLILVFLLLFAALCHAVPPPGILNHQGRIAINGSNYDGTGHFKFALLNGIGTPLWMNSLDGFPADGVPNTAVPVTVTNGHYSLALGDTSLTNMVSDVPASLFENTSLVFLRVWFSTVPAGPFELLTPARRITSGAYALHAAKAGSVTNNGITAAMLAAGSVTTEALGDGVVTNLKIADGAVSGVDSPDGRFTGVLQIDDAGTVGIGAGSNPLANLPPDLIPLGSDGTNISSPEVVTVQGNYAYVAGSGVLQIFDVSDPANIVAKGSDATGLVVAVSVAVQGDFAYVVDLGSDALHIFDISDPDNIVPRDSNGTGMNSPFSVAVQGDYAYVVELLGSNLHIFDVSDPDNIVPKDSDGTGLSDSRSVVVQGDYAYVGDVGSHLLHIFDISDPDDILPMGSDGTNLSFPRSVAVRGNYAYVADGVTNRLAIFDVADPNNIVPKSTAPATQPDAVVVQGAHAYTVSAVSGFLQVFDVSDADNITLVTSDASGLADPVSVAVQGPYAYVVDETTDVLQVFEIGPALALRGNLQFAAGGVRFSDGRLQTRAFGANSVTSSDITDASITALDLAPDSVDASEIATGAVGSTEILDNSITSVDLADDVAFNTVTITDSFQINTGGTLERILWDVAGAQVRITDDLSVDGNLTAANTLNLRDSNGTIFFQSSSGSPESFAWSGVRDRFALSDDLAISGLLVTGGIPAGLPTYNRIGTASSTHFSVGGDAEDLMVGGSLEVNGTLLADGGIRVGSDNSTDDDSIYFDTAAAERLYWDDSETRFEITDSLALDGPLNAGSWGDNVTTNYNFFANVEPAPDSGDMVSTGDLFIAEDLEVNGQIYADGGVINGSDRNRKENISPIDSARLLEKVVTMPISTWSYIDDERKRPHIGPMAQDFHAAFQLGKDDKRISSIDADGVALAAIQGLNAKVDAENDALRAENEALRNRLARLEAALQAVRESIVAK